MDNINTIQIGDVNKSLAITSGDASPQRKIEASSDSLAFLKQNNSSGTYGRYGLKNINNGWESNSDHDRQVVKGVQRLIEIIFSENYVDGELSKAQIYLEYLYNMDRDVFYEVFSRTCVSMYKEGSHYITTFINVASTIDYEWLSYRADLMITSFNSLDEPLVNEATIRAVESWEQKKHIEILERMRRFESKWLEDYKTAVLSYLRSL
jgi:hypothetical protein